MHHVNANQPCLVLFSHTKMVEQAIDVKCCNQIQKDCTVVWKSAKNNIKPTSRLQFNFN